MKRNKLLLQLNINLTMQKSFETTIKKKSHRERFYSSMNYDQFCDIYGPPSPLFKPLEDPIEDLPLFDLEQIPSVQEITNNQPNTTSTIQQLRMDTILEIDGSQNFTLNIQCSPKIDHFLTNPKQFLTKETNIECPKRLRVRMRSQSDNSEYLIFNFLERASQKGRKRIKIDQ